MFKSFLSQIILLGVSLWQTFKDRKSFQSWITFLFLGEAGGRFGNQFLVYMVLFMMKKLIGYESYISKECEGRRDFFLLSLEPCLFIFKELYT